MLVVGVGGLGCASATYLALAGVGTLRLADGDTVSTPDLGRQTLYSQGDWGRRKVEVAAERLKALNPDVRLEAEPHFLDRSNAASLFEDVDLLVDGTDALAPRRLMNRAAVTQGRPVVFGGATGFSGYVLACLPGSPCFECVWSEPPLEGCEGAGVIGPLVGMVGAAQAAEALKILVGLGRPLEGRLLLLDVLRAEHRTVSVRRRADCPVCGTTSSLC